MHTYFKHFYVIFKQKLYLGPQNDILSHLPTVLTWFKISIFNDQWLLTKCVVRCKDHVVKAKNFLEFFEIQVKIEGRCTWKKQKKLPLPRKLSIPPKYPWKMLSVRTWSRRMQAEKTGWLVFMWSASRCTELKTTKQ